MKQEAVAMQKLPHACDDGHSKTMYLHEKSAVKILHHVRSRKGDKESAH
jgi:hypothetical protein